MIRIALKGLIGRKGDTLILWTVVTLSFLFLVLSTTLITSLEATDAEQRLHTYGTWQVMGAGLSEETAAELAAKAEHSATLPMIPFTAPGVNTADADFFVSTYSPSLVELGQLTLREGHWPENRGEIVLDYAQMSAAGLSVGDELTLVYILQLPATEEYILEKQQMVDDYYYEKIGQYEEWVVRCLRDEAVHETEDGLQFYDTFFPRDTFRYYYQLNVHVGFFLYWADHYGDHDYLFADAEHPEGRAIPVNELTVEDIPLAFSAYESHLMDTSAYAYYTHRTTDLLGVDDLVINTAYTDNSAESNFLTAKMQYNFTVSGVMETFSDRWDSGQITLPRGFVSEDYYALVSEGKNVIRQLFPMFEDVPGEHMVFLSGAEGESAYDLWQKLLPTYNTALLREENFTAPELEYRGRMSIADDGTLTRIDDLVEQLSFRFTIADPDCADSRTQEEIHAWLVPTGWPESGCVYLLDEPMENQHGTPVDSFTGTLADMHEIAENEFCLRAFHSDSTVSRRTLFADLLTSTVRFDYRGERYELPLARFLTGDFTVDGKKVTVTGTLFRDTVESPTDYDLLRVNRFAYPPSGEGTTELLMLVVGILFVTTVCAVFQIFFSQIRKRLRRIVLLKSVGAVNFQITGMMVWEYIFFLVTTLPVGTALGYFSARYAAELLGTVQEREILLTVNRDLFLLSLAIGAVALFLGMLIPMFMAVGVPLTGRTVRKKALHPPRREKRQNFLNITLRNLFVNGKRTAGNFALCVFMMLIGVLCLFLGFRMMGEYRDTVVRDAMPEYRLRLPCALSIRQRGEYTEKLEALGVTDSVHTFLVGEDITILRESWDGSPLLEIAADTPFGYDADFSAVSSSDPLYEQLTAAATVGTLDPEAFDAGEEVLLMVPLYREGGEVNEAELERAKGWDRLAPSGIHTSYYAEYDGVYRRDEAVQVGDTLSLHTTTTTVVETRYVTSENFGEVRVGAILYYFPGTGIWPFAGDSEGYQVICSPSVLRMMLPDSVMSRTDAAIRALTKSGGVFYSNEHGYTDFYVNGRDDLSTEEVDTALLIFARSHNMGIEVYHETTEKLFLDAVNNILLCGLLGLTAVLLSLMIFGNTVSSELEQDRSRMGILQSLGVTNGRFARRQFFIGAAFSLLAAAIANILLWLGIRYYAQHGGIVIENLLWGYPYELHAAMCAAIAVIITALYVLPMRRLRKYLPIENIKTRK